MYLLSRLATKGLTSSSLLLLLASSARRSSFRRTYCSAAMSNAAHNAPGDAGPADQKKAKKSDDMKELRILMLHGKLTVLWRCGAVAL